MTLLADILTFIVIVLVIGPLWWLAAGWLSRKFEAMQARQMDRARERTRRTVEDDCGDQGGMPLPAPADYSDEVTDQHLERMAALVDQKQFEKYTEAHRPTAPHTGCGLPVGREVNGYGGERD